MLSLLLEHYSLIIMTMESNLFDVMPTELLGHGGNLDHAVDLFAGPGHVFFDEFEAFGGGFGCGGGFDLESKSSSVSDVNACLVNVEGFGYGEACRGESPEDGGDSSGTMTTTRRPGRDRSKTLVSERKRRSRMKEMLYELRSLVPNITKMDKASIIGDAVMYVKDLQEQVKKLVEEIARLRLSSNKNRSLCKSNQNQKKVQVTADRTQSIKGKIMELIALELGDRRFYVRLECNKGDRLPAALYAAVESLAFFRMESSDFSAAIDRYVMTFTVNVGDCGEEMNGPTLRLLVMGALLNLGFEFEAMATN